MGAAKQGCQWCYYASPSQILLELFAEWPSCALRSHDHVGHQIWACYISKLLGLLILKAVIIQKDKFSKLLP